MTGRADGAIAQTSPRRVLTYTDVVAGARPHFLRRATIRMDDLADDLAVSRATLYRIIDGRDRLLGDVLWSFGAPLLARVSRSTPGEGADRVVGISLRFAAAVHRPGPFREFLTHEPDTAIRVLCTPAGSVHERAIGAQKSIVLDAARGGGLRVPDDLDGFAYLYVRIIESLLYADLISERPPDLRLVEQAARATLAAS